MYGPTYNMNIMNVYNITNVRLDESDSKTNCNHLNLIIPFLNTSFAKF